MPVFTLFEMTYESVAQLPRESVVAVLPVGATEAHGPHLPLGTDVIIAEAMAREGARLLSDAGYTVMVLPAIGYTAAAFGQGFAGTLSAPPEAVTDTVVAIAKGLTQQGFRALCIANSHLDPTHIASLRSAVHRCREADCVPVVFPDVTRKPWALELGEEFRSGACHAGRYESSMVLAERPELVRDDLLRALPANPASLSVAIREGITTFEAAGGDRAYFGWPADATADEGRRTIAALGSILARAVAQGLAAA